jgi:TolB-like protein
VLWLLVLVSGAGCARTVVVPIRVKVAADIDTQKYPTLAVLPFADRDGRLTEEQLTPLADVLRRSLGRIPGVSVLGSGATSEGIGDRQLSVASLESPEEVAEWAQVLDVSAVVTGIVRYYTAVVPHRRYVERYSLQLQRYVTEQEDSWVRTHHLALEVAVRDGETGEILVRPPVRAASYEERQSILGDVLRAATGPGRILYDLARAPLNDFVRRITPHYEYEERYLSR